MGNVSGLAILSWNASFRCVENDFCGCVEDHDDQSEDGRMVEDTDMPNPKISKAAPSTPSPRSSQSLGSSDSEGLVTRDRSGRDSYHELRRRREIAKGKRRAAEADDVDDHQVADNAMDSDGESSHTNLIQNNIQAFLDMSAAPLSITQGNLVADMMQLFVIRRRYSSLTHSNNDNRSRFAEDL